MFSQEYAALLVDLDGTLIGRDEKISPRVLEAMGRLPANLAVSIATGREQSDAIRFARELGLTTPVVSDSGALILDPINGKPLWSSPLGDDRAEEIVDRLRALGLLYIASHPGGIVADGAAVAGWDLTRISALDMENDFADELAMEFVANLDLHVIKTSLPYNGLWAVDFTRVGVNKASGARRLAAMLGTDIGHVIAAGDSYNDLPLLEACGLRIVMGDAPEELRAIADYVAPSVDEDGLAVAIDEFLLPGLRA